MSEQLSTPRRSVALAAVFLALAAVAFGASYYLLDGASLVDPITQEVRQRFAAFYSPESSTETTSPPEPSADDEIYLPDGMPIEFALRLWQEQVDSQSVIERLVSGEVGSLKINRVQVNADEAVLHSTINFTDGASAPGRIGLKRFGETWYVAYASSERNAPVEAKPNRALPSVSEVDIPLLNTIIRENRKSRSVVDEYVAGIVKEVVIESVSRGPQTVTMAIEMDETHGDGYANLIAIRRDLASDQQWFLARFIKTGDESATAK